MQRLIALPLLALVAMPAVAATDWQIRHEESRLGFTATQQGGEFDGRFRDFDATMRFSPDDLGGSGFDVSIDVTSITTGSSDRDEQLPAQEWFYFERYPEASFVTREIRAVDGGEFAYEAVGELTIRGSTHEVVLPFDWRIDGGTATMEGRVAIDRTRYGVGQGEWEDGDTVGREVTVEVDLTLEKGAS
ncbi:YceI family protein [Arhodomonas sp. AD133]|uniref:YceI family protein n=1 Tax=Arhodomonas sp. AD133 TaxID=3415009 RepID=UPI003EC144B6